MRRNTFGVALLAGEIFPAIGEVLTSPKNGLKPEKKTLKIEYTYLKLT
jgi:hypothetical protein